MKDVVTEIQASEDLSVKHTEVELQSADGATKAYILYSREPDEFNAAAKSVSYGGAELLSAKVYADEAEAISFAEVTGAKLEEVKIPGGLARDAFIKKWLKAAKKNKQGLLPFLLLPLTACCHSGGSALLTSFSGTLAAANALNTALFTSSFTVTLSDAGSMDAGDLGTLLTKTSGAVTAASVTELAGTAAEIETVLAKASQVTSLSTVNITSSDAITVAQAIAADSFTTGVITGVISDGDVTTLKTLTDANSNNALTIVVTDTTADAGDLAIIDGVTTVTVDAQTNVTTITGSTAEIIALINAAGINIAANVNFVIEAVELSAIEQDNNAGGFVINGVSASDRSGGPVSSAGDVNGDGFDDLIIGARYDDPNGSSSGASFVVFGKSTGTAVELSDVEAGTGGFVINGVSASDFSGGSVSSAGDVNGDGFDDLIIGAGGDDPNGSSSGASFVVFGKSTGTAVELSDVEAGTGGFVINGVSANDGAGGSVSSAGDVNGDGFDDLIIGARGDDPNGVGSGASFVVFGKSTGTAVELSAIEQSNNAGGFVINGVSASDAAGDSVSSAGDVNGDGFDDLIIGAPGDDPNGSYSGASFVVFGKSNGKAVALSYVEAGIGGFVINGVTAFDRSGEYVSSAGDVNGDGFDDLIIGAYFDSPNGIDSGASFVVFGKSTGTAVELSAIEQDNNAGGFVINGVSAFDRSGDIVSSAGDVNGDGFDDLIIGAPGDDPNGSYSGASFVVFGKSTGTAVDLSDVEAGTGGFVINGVSANVSVGGFAASRVFVSGAGDVNGDGFDDLIIGSTHDDPNGSYSGASFVVFGGNFTGAATQVGTTGNDTLTGSTGNDNIFAGTGNDIINGSAGIDRVSGGNGADVFTFSTDTEAVTIIDFNQNENDQIDLSAFNIADFTTLQGSVTESGQGNHDVKITLDADTFVFIENFDVGTLVSGDFIL